MPVQTVDATPSGIKPFSKVVFMKQGRRFGLSAEQKLDVWRRWKAGQTLHEIGRAFGKEHSSIRCLVSRHGGIAPAIRRRSLLALTQREREERTPPYCRSNPTVTRHQTTNGGMFFAKSAPDLMQRLPCLPTTPHVEFLLSRKPKPSPWPHKHHL